MKSVHIVETLFFSFPQASPEVMQACMAVLTEEQKTALNENLAAPTQ